MAKAVKSEFILYDNVSNKDMRALDVQVLANGQLGVAFGGSLVADGIVYAGIYDLATSQLGPLSETLFPGNASGGVPVTTVRRIEIDAARNDNMVLTLHMANSEIGADGNFSLLTQVFDGSTPTGTPHAVNPATPGDVTNDIFATITRGDGSYQTFYSEIGGGVNLSDGIRMASFRADGTMIGAPKLVLPDHAAGIFDANPESVSATLMANGNTGLLYKENLANGQSTVLFQQITRSGTAVGAPLVLQDQAALPGKVVSLADGTLLCLWLSIDAQAFSTLKGQRLDGSGVPLGGSFTIAATPIGSQTVPDVVALANGDFAVSWLDGGIVPMARLFDSAGHALGNDFTLTENVGALDSYSAFGLTAKGNQLIAFAGGQETGKTGVILSEVFATTSTLGANWSGSSAGNSKTGTGNDDSFDGRSGNDSLKGAAGNDILTGGLGKDTLSGDQGHDVIRGGANTDILSGGAGGDFFLFASPGEGRDVIRDFNLVEGDKIGLDNMAFGREIYPGFVMPMLFPYVTNAATTDAAVSGLHFNTTTKVLSFDADGAGTAYERLDIAVLQGVSSLSFVDIILA